jgi:hypothetical protein
MWNTQIKFPLYYSHMGCVPEGTAHLLLKQVSAAQAQ